MLLVNNSSYLTARKSCIHLGTATNRAWRVVLSQRVANKAARPVSHGKKRGLAGGTPLPEFSQRPCSIFSWKRWKRSLIIKRYSMLVHSAYPRTRHQSFQGDSWVSWSKKLKQPYLLCCTATRSDCQFSQKSKSLSQAPAADASPDGGQAASMYVLPPASSLHFPPLPC